MKLKILLLTVLVANVYANSASLLNSIKENIHTDKGWEQVEQFDSGVTVLTKEIPNITIKAVKVYQLIDIEPEIIAEVVEDIPNYSEFLKSAKAMDANLLSVNENGLFGHQHLDLKYVKDRHYAFNMFRPLGNSERVDWELIPEETFNKIEESARVNKKGVYIDIGYGSWLVEKLDNGKTKISYRLVMHPGGSVPNFAIDYINKVAIVGLFEDTINEALNRSKRN